MRTVRGRLYQLAGNVGHHVGAVPLNVQVGLWALCDEIRTRGAEAAQTCAWAGGKQGKTSRHAGAVRLEETQIMHRGAGGGRASPMRGPAS